MQRKSLLAAALAVAFAFPLAATAGTNKDKATSANGGNDGGAAAMFKSMDKNGDGKLSADEHFNAKEHVAARSKDSPTSASSKPAKKTY